MNDFLRLELSQSGYLLQENLDKIILDPPYSSDLPFRVYLKQGFQ